MNDELAGNSSAAEVSKKPEEVPGEPLLPFVEDVIKSIPSLEFQQHYRVTLHGLFVDPAARENLTNRYEEWFKKTTGINTEYRSEKWVRKLFGDEKPRLYYLHEGKTCLRGYIVPCRLPNPQGYRRPFYLGTPTAATEMLHPQDPLFSEIPGITAKETRNGIEITVTLRGRDYIIPVAAVQHFIQLAHSSVKVKKRYPNYGESLSESTRALLELLRRTKLLRPNREVIRPFIFEHPRARFECRSSSGFYFYFDGARRLALIYHLFGRNIFNFVRDEIVLAFAGKDRHRFRSFEVFHRKHECLGVVEAHGRRLAISPHAFVNFVGEVLRSPSILRQKDKTILWYIEEFIMSMQLSQPIEFAKVAAFVPPKLRRGQRCFTYKQWLFLVSDRYIITECLSRTARNRKN